MKKFEFLEHTADVRMKIYGSTMEELFKNAVLGMANIQTTNNKQQITIKKEIRIKSQNIETLLVDFLSAVLTQSDIEHAVFPDAKIKKLTETEIEAEIFGAKVDKFDEDIKAVTYHGAEVKKIGDHWEAVVLFDI